jgi:uroporphyrinogen-III synthase
MGELPLAGRTVLVTRPRHQADDLVRPLEALGATTAVMPVIEIVPPESYAELDAALLDLARFDWVVLTSVNGVEAVIARMDELGVPRERLAERRLAVVGSATVVALARAVRAPDAVPEEYVGEAIAEAMGEVRGEVCLLARADRARPELPQRLREKGAIVQDVVAYRIVRTAAEDGLPGNAPDAILLTSSESARATFDALKARGRGDWFARASLVCIGPVTAETVAELGYKPSAVAKTHTIPGLVDALVSHVQNAEAANA